LVEVFAVSEVMDVFVGLGHELDDDLNDDLNDDLDHWLQGQT